MHESMIKVDVRDNDVEQALRRLKKVMNREGRFREMRDRRYCIKPAQARAEQKREAQRRIRKAEWKRRQDM